MRINQILRLGGLLFAVSIASIKLLQLALLRQEGRSGSQQEVYSRAQSAASIGVPRCSTQSKCVEFSIPGLWLPLELALDINFPIHQAEREVEQQLLNTFQKGTNTTSIHSSGTGSKIQKGSATQRRSGDHRKKNQKSQKGRSPLGRGFWSFYRGWSPPQARAASPGVAGLRILVAVTSCSTCSVSFARRNAARSTWVRLILDTHKNIDVRFVLAQPSPSDRAKVLRPLRAEAEASGDLVVVRGTEEYRNLPNKTLRLLRYALSGTKEWTHVLKTDDDCYIRGGALLATLQLPARAAQQRGYRFRGVYTGCLENVHGFYPLRNEDSKWYISYEEMPDEVVPWAKKYLAGWRYMLSSDVALHIVGSMLQWEKSPADAPGWYAGLHWEDVMVGLIASEVVGDEPQAHDAFVPAWKKCTPETAVRHLDVEAPKMFQPLAELDKSGAWQARNVPCTEGDYEVDNYWSWKGWRDGLEGVQALGNVG